MTIQAFAFTFAEAYWSNYLIGILHASPHHIYFLRQWTSTADSFVAMSKNSGTNPNGSRRVNCLKTMSSVHEKQSATYCWERLSLANPEIMQERTKLLPLRYFIYLLVSRHQFGRHSIRLAYLLSAASRSSHRHSSITQIVPSHLPVAYPPSRVHPRNSL